MKVDVLDFVQIIVPRAFAEVDPGLTHGNVVQPPYGLAVSPLIAADMKIALRQDFLLPAPTLSRAYFSEKPVVGYSPSKQARQRLPLFWPVAATIASVVR